MKQDAQSQFNDYMLFRFAKCAENRNGIEQLVYRYQSLAIIYLNLLFLPIILVWKVISLIAGPLPGDEVIKIFLPLQLISMVLMMKGKKDAAGVAFLLGLHIGNYIASAISNITLGASCFVQLLPGLTFFITSSAKIHLLNLVLCLLQNIGHTSRFRNIFKVTFTEEQNHQIFVMAMVSFVYIPISWMIFRLQKSIETDLWQVANSNYQKAENITKELVEAVEAKDKVVSSFSHEIRNPLNALNGSIDYLLKVTHDPSHAKVLKNAKLSGEVLLNLVNNVLDAAKLKAEKMEVACVESNPTDVIRRVFDINTEIITQKKINTRAYIDKSIPLKLYIDPSRLLQVIMNLFSNAVKFLPEEGTIKIYMQWFKKDSSREELLNPFLMEPLENKKMPTNTHLQLREPRMIYKTKSLFQISKNDFQEDTSEFEELEQATLTKHQNNISYLNTSKLTQSMSNIKLQSSLLNQTFSIVDPKSNYSTSEQTDHTIVLKNDQKKGFLKVQISDSGTGITEQNLPRLFQMFSQIEHNNHFQNQGTGLGLWICKQLCQKMGGDITIQSKPNVGTTVIFYIAVDNDPISARALSTLRSIPSDKVRALVVDDYAYNRDVHKLILEREGVEVSVACNGREAVERYLAQIEGYFSFILMDIQMPEMDGITAAHEIRKFESEKGRKQIDIYFVSGNYYSQNEVFGNIDSTGQGSNRLNTQFLRKPIDIYMIKKIVEKYHHLLKGS